MNRRIAGLLSLAGLLLLATGCEQPLVDEGGEATPTREPAVEGTGPEKPAPQATGKFHVETANLPWGSPNDGQTMQDRSCLQINWLGPAIPPGAAVKITNVDFTPDGQFSTEPYEQCDTDLCENGYEFDAENDEDNEDGWCNVPAAVEPADAYASLKVSAKIQCAAGETRVCRYFYDLIKKGKRDKIEISGTRTSAPPGASEAPPPTEPAAGEGN